MEEQLREIREHLARNEIKKAEVVVSRLLRLNLAPSQRAQVLLQRARARLISARAEDAIDDLLSVQRFAPELAESPMYLELLGDCYFARFELASVGFADRSDTVRAEQAYHQILNNFPDYENLGWVYYQLGRALATQMKVGEANACFQKALLSPSSVAALTAFCYERLAFIAFYESRDLNAALGFANKAVDTYPAAENQMWLVQVHILRSRILREMRQDDMALKAAVTAVTVASASSGSENKSGLSEALLTAGELVYNLGGREREVVSYLQQFLQITRKPLGVDVTRSRVHEMLGDAYLALQQYDMAVSSYQSALQHNPDHPWEVSLYYRMARACYSMHDYEKAIEAINRMLKAAETDGQSVTDYRVYDVLGNAQFALKRYAQAAEAYQMALRIAPPNAEDLDKIKTYWQFAQELSVTL